MENSPIISIITPAYNEEDNLRELHQRLSLVFDQLHLDWEWLVVDDHSRDNTFGVLKHLAVEDPRVRGIRLARNSGSHAALICGLSHARGTAAIIMVADLQNPPEVLSELIARWQTGAQVVWAARAKREGDKANDAAFALLYWWILRNIAGIRDLSPGGSDFVLLDRAALDSFLEFKEGNQNIFATIAWMGLRQSTLTYIRKPRLRGKSGWSLEKKFKLVIDSMTAFTYFPIRVMSYVGFAVAFLGFLYTFIVIFNHFFNQPIQGWSSLMIVVLVTGGIQMMMMGVLGEYLWRVLDETRRRPRYIIEDSTNLTLLKNGQER